ncbi:MAG TPA: methyltransferase domain-containing protein [Vicinamibacterales bacterium]|jgi:SAM-dependent methyltransferase|nr:methyltransferase domain-containing protein [Vicinamibacterales bacterium]
MAQSSGLHSVDQSVDQQSRLQFLDAEGAKPAMRAAKARSFEALEIRASARLLEVGCGAGEDARALARLVGPHGHVDAIDAEPAMVAEAVRRAASERLPLTFSVGDAYHLDYADASFDGARAERVLLHVAEPGRVLAQMARVVKSGAKIVVIDRDIETRTIDASDRILTRRILHFWCDSFLGGWIGRQLPRLFREAGLSDVTVEPVTVVERDFAAFDAQYNLTRVVDRAVRAGAITRDEGTGWLAALHDRADAGSFFSSMTSFVVDGRKG